MDYNSIISVSQEHVSAYLSDEAVILNLKTGIYFGLNSIGTFIWNLIQNPQKISSIRDSILAEYNVTPDRCEQDVIDLIQRLAEVGLVEINYAQDPQIS